MRSSSEPGGRIATLDLGGETRVEKETNAEVARHGDEEDAGDSERPHPGRVVHDVVALHGRLHRVRRDEEDGGDLTDTEQSLRGVALRQVVRERAPPEEEEHEHHERGRGAETDHVERLDVDVVHVSAKLPATWSMSTKER